jgi:Flp pilus assembly pilin Flp
MELVIGRRSGVRNWLRNARTAFGGGFRFMPVGEQGASSIEYGILIAAVAALIIAIAVAIGFFVQDLFQSTSDAISDNFPP